MLFVCKKNDYVFSFFLLARISAFGKNLILFSRREIEVNFSQMIKNIIPWIPNGDFMRKCDFMSLHKIFIIMSKVDLTLGSWLTVVKGYPCMSHQIKLRSFYIILRHKVQSLSGHKNQVIGLLSFSYSHPKI